MRAMGLAGAVLGLVALAGCASAPAERTAAAGAVPDALALRQVAERCDARHPVAQGSFAANVRCNNEAVEALVAGSPNADLVRRFQAAGLAIAERVDRGGMTLEEADRAMAAAEADYEANLAQRGAPSMKAALSSP
jgi:hypothetical protein